MRYTLLKADYCPVIGGHLNFPPIIDGTFASCDRLFEILQAFLISLGITAATHILFVADGAAWIWRRIPKLIKALGLKAEQVLELIDFRRSGTPLNTWERSWRA